MTGGADWAKMRERLMRKSASESSDDAVDEPPSGTAGSFGRRGASLLGERDVEPDGARTGALIAQGQHDTSATSPKLEPGHAHEIMIDAANDQPAVVTSDVADKALNPVPVQDRNDTVAPLEAPLESSPTASISSPPLPTPEPLDRGPMGHVISVSGSVVWGLFESQSDHAVEIGNIVRLHRGGGRSFGIVTTLRRDGRRDDDDRRLMEIKLLGEIADDMRIFQCGVSKHPALDSPINMADRDELLLIYRRPDVPTLRLGTLRQADSLPAYAVTDQLLGKHFAILGTTGAGKSCAVTVLLRAIIASNPFGHIVMLDPHNEYGQAFGDQAEALNPKTLKLPYWLLNFEEISEVLVNKESAESAYAEVAILRDAILRARKVAFGEEKNSDHITVDTPTPYRLSDLVRIIKEDMGAFNRAESVAPFQHLISRIERTSSDRRFSFMFSSFMVQDSMAQVMSSILRLPVRDKPVTIIDLSGMPSEIVDVVVSVLFRLVFEFALWTDRTKAPPILLVCEEAHRYVPRDDEAAFAPTKRAISRIAKEGRKYGLSLGLITQRPAELSVSSLSQCNTIVALRMSNEHDLKFVQHAIPESSRWLTDTMPSLNTREAVVIGAGVAVPMHIRFDELPPEHRPASTTPAFSAAWQKDVVESDLVERTIESWRYQRRGED